MTLSLTASVVHAVNPDGTLARIANWDKMTEAEQRNTMRIIGQRNRKRLAKLQECQQAPAGP